MYRREQGPDSLGGEQVPPDPLAFPNGSVRTEGGGMSISSNEEGRTCGSGWIKRILDPTESTHSQP